MCWSWCWAERSRVWGWATVGMECCADLWSFAVIDAFPRIDEHRLLEVMDQRDVDWPWWSRGVKIALSQRCQRVDGTGSWFSLHEPLHDVPRLDC